jgi:hypothetical protein
MWRLACSISIAALAASLCVGQSFNSRDFGAIPDGRSDSGEAIRAALKKAISAQQPSEIVLDAGVYRVAPERPGSPCLPINGADGLVVRGAGRETVLIFTDPISTGISINNSRNVTVRDITIDYDPLPFCQGTIRAVDLKNGHFDLEISEGYPAPDGPQFLKAIEPYGKWGMIMDRATRRIKAGTPDHYMTPRWELVDGRTWRFFTAHEHFRRQLSHMNVGDAYVHLGRGHGTAILSQWSENVRVERILVHSSPGLAVGLIGNRGELIVRGLQVRFAPGSDRLLTTNADGVHCQQNRTGPIIEQSFFEGMADDGINIYTPPNVLLEIRSPSEWLVSAGCRIFPGDRLQVLDPRTGRVRGVVQAADVKADGRRLLLAINEPLDGAAPGNDHRTADTLYNMDACGAGFQIRNNEFIGHRRYGCLLRAGDGTVEGNLFQDTTGAGIVITNEPDWPEGPAPWNISITRNRFVRGGTCAGYADSPRGAALVIQGSRLGHALANANSVRGITVVENHFIDLAGAAVFAGGASDVRLISNRISSSPQAELRRKSAAIVVDQSASVVITGTEVHDERPGVTAAVEIRPGAAPDENGVRIIGLDSKLAPGVPAVIDLR